jgi:hypothetical protein
MSAVAPEAPLAPSERVRRYSRVLVRQMWASLAIISMWLAVLFDALLGPDFVSSNAAGTNTTSIPSAIVVRCSPSAPGSWLAMASSGRETPADEERPRPGGYPIRSSMRT